MEYVSGLQQNQSAGAPTSRNNGDPTVGDIWPSHRRRGPSRPDSRCAAALKGATAKVVRLEQQLAERDKHIHELERQLVGATSQVERLEIKLAVRDEADEAAAEDFERLCVAIDDYFYSIRFFPIALQLEFEAVAARLGAARTW